MPDNKSNPFQAVYIPTLDINQAALLRETSSSLIPKTIEELQQEADEVLSDLQKKIQNGASTIQFSEPRPLTVAEAKDVVAEKERVLKKLKDLRTKLSKIDDYIDTRLTSEGSRFIYHFKTKPRLRKAMKILFGEARDYITYEDYTKALALKKELEQEDAYSFFNEDEEDTYEIT